MLFQKVNISLHKIALLLFFALIFSGCMQKPWGDPVLESLETSLRKKLSERGVNSHCPSAINADATITWSSAYSSGSLKGVIQSWDKAYLKIVAVNPLGLPILALVTNGTSFQSVNTMKQEFFHGRIYSLAHRLDIPEPLLSGKWGERLTGGLPTRDDEILKIYEDSQKRGLWMVTEQEYRFSKNKEYLLFSPNSLQLIERVLTDENGKIVATIAYSDWQIVSKCNLPTRLLISGLSAGMEATIEMRDILTGGHFNKNNFKLNPPSGYLQRNYR